MDSSLRLRWFGTTVPKRFPNDPDTDIATTLTPTGFRYRTASRDGLAPPVQTLQPSNGRSAVSMIAAMI